MMGKVNVEVGTVEVGALEVEVMVMLEKDVVVVEKEEVS